MTIRLSTGLRNAMLDTTGMAGALENGVIYIYSGAQPLSADNAVSGTLLGKVTVDGGAFAFGSPTNGLNFDAPVAGVITKAVAEDWKFDGIVDGTAGWFRFMGNATDALGSSTTLPRIDGSVGTSGADLNLSNISIVTAGPNTVDVFQITMPSA